MRDYTIRQLLRRTELSRFLTDPHSKVIEEFKLPIAGARADIAVINGNIHAYEIKSAVDTLKRLPSQLEAYTKVFDFISVITEGKHYKKIQSLLPDFVGLYICEEKRGQEVVKQIQKPKKNTSVEGFYIAKLLWRDEILSILAQYKIPHRRADRNWIQCEVLANNFDAVALSAIVREKLKCRPEDWRLQQTV
jgi:hypothetical protein